MWGTVLSVDNNSVKPVPNSLMNTIRLSRTNVFRAMIKDNIFQINEPILPNNMTVYAYLRQIILEKSQISGHINMLEHLLDSGANVSTNVSDDDFYNIGLLNKIIQNESYPVAFKLLTALLKSKSSNLQDSLNTELYKYLRHALLENAEIHPQLSNMLGLVLDAGTHIGNNYGESILNVSLLNMYLEKENFSNVPKLLGQMIGLIPWGHIYNVYAHSKKTKNAEMLQYFHNDKENIARKIQQKLDKLIFEDMINAIIFLTDTDVPEVLLLVVQKMEALINETFSDPTTNPSEEQMTRLETIYDLKEGPKTLRKLIKAKAETFIGGRGIRLGKLIPAKIYARMKKFIATSAGRRSKTRKYKYA